MSVKKGVPPAASKMRLLSVQVIPSFVQVDEDGEFDGAPGPLTNEQGQMVAFNIGAKEWRTGWDWQAAFDTLIEQLGLPK